MDEILQFTLLLVLTASVILQVSAAFFAVRLMRLSRYHFSWIMLCAALMLMAARRAIALYHLFSIGLNHPFVLYAETVALLISILLVAGLFSIAPLMRRIYYRSDVEDGSSLGELFEKVTNGVIICAPVDKGRDFTILDINPAAERIEKIARQHVAGRLLTEAFPGMEAFGLPDVLRRVCKTGQPERFPMRYYKDERISGWRDTFVYRRAGGDVVAVYNDVSAQMHTQEELDRRERKFRTLFRQTELAYQVLDSDGRILDVNPAWLRLIDLERSAAVGRPFSELLTREGRQKLPAFLAELKKDGSVAQIALELRRKDGILLPIELNALSLCGRTGGSAQIECLLREKSAGEKESAVQVGVDQQARTRDLELLAGERRALQQQRLSLLSQLAGGMAHELNAPLAAARNAFNLMNQGMDQSGSQREFSEIASRELARMADRIERMYRIHNPVSMACDPLNINALLDNTLLLVRSMLREQGIQLQDERADRLPIVMLPPGAVMLTLLNPIKNSIEAMSPNGRLTLRTGTAEQGGVFVEIEDNGPGIPNEFMPRLFEPFATFRHSGAQQGIGLGLAIVQQTLDVLGGSITVSSNLGEGTCVRIILPAELKSDA